MYDVELILALMLAVVVAAVAARALRVPYPILLVVGGLLLALTPAVPNVGVLLRQSVRGTSYANLVSGLPGAAPGVL